MLLFKNKMLSKTFKSKPYPETASGERQSVITLYYYQQLFQKMLHRTVLEQNHINKFKNSWHTDQGDLLFDKSNKVEFIIVALPLSTNTIKHDTEKINKCVAVSRAKTNLETKEHQLSWQWGVVSHSSQKSEGTRDPVISEDRISRQLDTSNSKPRADAERILTQDIETPGPVKAGFLKVPSEVACTVHPKNVHSPQHHSSEFTLRISRPQGYIQR